MCQCFLLCTPAIFCLSQKRDLHSSIAQKNIPKTAASQFVVFSTIDLENINSKRGDGGASRWRGLAAAARAALVARGWRVIDLGQDAG